MVRGDLAINSYDAPRVAVTPAVLLTLPERTRLCVSIAKIDLSSESVDPRIAVHCTRTLEA
eukprot:COSAG02_NODE_38390_length_429_cov_1.321212_1_plen_60_part_10